MNTRKIIKANYGMILTDGEIYGTMIYLAEGKSADDFYEISAEEYAERTSADAEAKDGGDCAE